MNANSRIARSSIITDIVNGIRVGGGGFVRYDQQEMRWYDVGDKIARDKVRLLKEYWTQIRVFLRCSSFSIHHFAFFTGWAGTKGFSPTTE